MDSYIGSFAKLAGAAKATPHGAEDYFDRLNYSLTPALLLAVATIVGMKQYVFQPIQCWSVQELDGHRMEYAENYCWVENTFHYRGSSPIHHDDSVADGRTIYYYQWVPFILMAQAALFYLPHLVWLLLSSNTGVDIRQMADQSRQVETDDEETRQKKVKFLANQLLKFVRFRRRFRSHSLCRRAIAFALGQPAFAMYLVFAYLLVKACYIGNCVGQLHLMRSFLGLNMSTFGLRLFSDILQNRTWHTTFVFPRVTYCRFDARTVGSQHTYTLQCVLPVNMLNEKFYILIWFWVVAVLLFNVFSAARCVLKLLLSPRRQKLVKKFLKIAESVGGNSFCRDRDLEDAFVDEFLETDGAFLLSVVNKNSGDIVTADVVKAAFHEWKADCFPPNNHEFSDAQQQRLIAEGKPVPV